MQLRRLLPDPGPDLTIAEVVSAISLAERAPAERPYVILNMAITADGQVTIDGRSRGIADRADRELFHALRGCVDALLIGGRTLEKERYGRIIKDEDRRRDRVAAGLAPDPLAVVITRSGRVATDVPIFHEPEQRVVIFSAREVDLDTASSNVEVVECEPGDIAPAEVMRALRAEHGIRTVLCEGGPSLNAALLGDGVVDELFLAIGPRWAGGDGPTVVSGPALPEPRRLNLVHVLESEDNLFLRYRVTESQ